MNLMILFCSFKDIYNSQLKERYRDNPLNHPDIDPDLWLEAGLFDGPNRNQVYELCNTTAENLWMTRCVLKIGCSRSISSIQTLEFAAMLDQQVQDQTTYLNDKYKWLTADYEEFRRLVMEIRSYMWSLCVYTH